MPGGLTEDRRSFAAAQKNKPKSSGSSGSSSSFDEAVTSGASKSPSYDPTGVTSAYENLQQEIADATAMNPLTAASNNLPGMLDQRIMDDVNNTEAVVSAREQLNRELREQRAAAIGVDPNRQEDPVNIKSKVDRMTREEYRDLTPLQKAAVNFNTNLVAAVRKDRKLQDVYAPTEQQRATYGEAIENAFPTMSSGSVTYAPETMAVLRQIDYSDAQADLDDFLNLEAAIKAKDLKRLEPKDLPDLPARASRGMGGGAVNQGRSYDNPLTGDRVGQSELLARGTLELQQSLDKGNQLLAQYGMTTALAEDRETDVRLLGGAPTREATLIGYGNSKLDEYFQTAFDTLANNSSDPNIMFQIFRNELDEPQRKAFMEYAQARIMNSVKNGTALGETEGVTYRNPVQVAELLGLPGLQKSEGARDGGAAPSPASPPSRSQTTVSQKGAENADPYGP